MLMKKIFVILSLISFSSITLAEKFSTDEILGFWLTKEERAVIQIYKNGDKYEGKLVWLIDVHNGKKEIILDDKNPDEDLQKRNLQGLINLKGFIFEDGEWVDGEIYDPNKGKTYSAKMKLENKNELHLRGYIGIPMFGRTSEWVRQAGITPDKFQKQSKK